MMRVTSTIHPTPASMHKTWRTLTMSTRTRMKTTVSPPMLRIIMSLILSTTMIWAMRIEVKPTAQRTITVRRPVGGLPWPHTVRATGQRPNDLRANYRTLPMKSKIQATVGRHSDDAFTGRTHTHHRPPGVPRLRALTEMESAMTILLLSVLQSSWMDNVRASRTTVLMPSTSSHILLSCSKGRSWQRMPTRISSQREHGRLRYGIMLPNTRQLSCHLTQRSYDWYVLSYTRPFVPLPTAFSS